jgi:hypothetical protein
MGKSFNTGNLTNIIGYSGSNVAITGSVNISGTVVSTGTSLVSGSGQISYTGITNIPSGIVSGSAQLPSGIVSSSAQTIANLPSGVVSGSAQVTTFGFGTTGSNTFQGSQTINGSLVVTGSLTAQQFIISSSVTYLTESFASGSHKFGDSSDDTHQFTGSLYVTGSVNVGASFGNSQLYVGGLSAQTSSALLDSGTRNGLITILSAGGTAGNGGGIVLGSNTQGNDTGFGQIALKAILISGAGQGTSDFVISTRNATSDTALTERLRLTSAGLLGINKNSPNTTLDVNGNALVSGSLTTTGTINGLSLPNDLFAQQFLLMGS